MPRTISEKLESLIGMDKGRSPGTRDGPSWRLSPDARDRAQRSNPGLSPDSGFEHEKFSGFCSQEGQVRWIHSPQPVGPRRRRPASASGPAACKGKGLAPVRGGGDEDSDGWAGCGGQLARMQWWAPTITAGSP